MDDYPYISRFLRGMMHSGIQALDRQSPHRICAEQYSFEFHDRATAERFQHDLIEFAQHWDPEDEDQRARRMLEYQRPGMVLGKPRDLTITDGTC